MRRLSQSDSEASLQLPYAELHAHSAFTFLEGANSPDQLVHQAAKLGLSGIGILDVDGMYSAVQSARAGLVHSIPIVHGVELTLSELRVSELPAITGSRGSSMSGGLTDLGSGELHVGMPLHRGIGVPSHADDPGLRLPVLATCQEGYHALCSLLSKHFLDCPGRRKASVSLAELADAASTAKGKLIVLTGTSRGPLQRALAAYGMRAARSILETLKEIFGPDGLAIELQIGSNGSTDRSQQLSLLAAESGLPLVATGAVRIADPSSQPLADVLTSTRLGASLEQAEQHLPAWRTFLRSPREMTQLYQDHPDALVNAVEIAKRCAFSLTLIEPGLPSFPVPERFNLVPTFEEADEDQRQVLREAAYLRHLTYLGANEYYGERSQNPQAWELIDHELQVIENLGFPGYFLIVKDIVDFCSDAGILCQGRGSAANSAVCYALGITAVDAVKHKMLFERFLSPERKEAPDIDLDIEASEREQVIQYVYQQYGRKNAAQVANVISYRPKSAIRDAGKAFGYPEGISRRWSKLAGRSSRELSKMEEDAIIPEPVVQMALQLQRLPRHMGIHPGGMVLTRRPVSEVCPITWAAKEGRSVLQWDKEDCADAGLVKFDLLGLGMLTALRRAYTWLEKDGESYNGKPLGLHNTPPEDPRVYDLLCAADTVGVFQVESRAQMNTLPRLKPREFYQIVIEVALIRPGPIQGKAVSPYLRRKNDLETVEYLHPLLEPALKKTLGVPLFQEQLMQIAVDAAGFTPGQADQLRRAIGSKRSDERMRELKPALFEGMRKNGISDEICEQLFDQLKGFAQFGFPESHAFSFAYLVYASAWLKVFHPEHFYASILASQPMGFYSPASLVNDARRHGVKVLPPSVCFSNVKTEPVSLESHSHSQSSTTPVDKRVAGLVKASPGRGVRLGLEQIRGLGKAAERIVTARQQRPFKSLSDLARRARLTETQIEVLASSGALADLGIERRQGIWVAAEMGSSGWEQPFLPGTEPSTAPETIPPLSEKERFGLDFQAMGFSAEGHPLRSMRQQLEHRGILPLSALDAAPVGSLIQIAGQITHRQRPPTASGTTFLSLEDETGLANIICSQGLWTRYRQVAMESTALIVRGRIERGQGAVAVVADKLESLQLPVRTVSRDFR